jgi:penicillin amidase
LLRAPAEPWTAEDTILSVYAMYLDLQESDGATERRRANAVDALGEALAAFLFPEGTSWDAPLDGSMLPTPPLPETIPHKRAEVRPGGRRGDVESAAPGSNGWAVGGPVSARGAAIVANDMHLGLRCRTSGIAHGLCSKGTAEPLLST